MAMIVITPPRRFSLPPVHQLWEAREVLYRFGTRDVTLRYRQTALGVVWVLLQPLLIAGIFVVLFNRIAKIATPVTPIVFVFCGMLVWNLFSGIIGRAATSLVSNRDLVSKVFFPRMLVPLATSVSNITDFVVTMIFLFVLQGIFGVAPGVALILAPIWAAMVLLLACGCGLVAAALQVRYRDITYVVPFVLQVLLFVSPIGYPVPDKYHVIFDLNPLTWLLGDFRWSFLNVPAPPLWQIVLSIIVPTVVFLGGSIIFEQMERSFADYI
jgi:homopolymeric O-antigen transport system permease protein